MRIRITRRRGPTLRFCITPGPVVPRTRSPKPARSRAATSAFLKRVRHCIDWGKQEEEELEERGKLSLSQGSKTQEHSTIAGFVLSTRLGAMLLLSAAILFATLPAYANTKSHRHRSSHTKKSSSRS